MINTTKKITGQQKKSQNLKTANLTHPRTGSKRFSIIPDEIKKRLDLSPCAKYVYGDLIKYAGKNNYAFPTRKTISESCGISIKVVDRCIRELKEKSLIHVTQRGLRKSNVYEFIEQAWQREAKSPPPTTEENSGVRVLPEMPLRVVPIGIEHSNTIHIAGNPVKRPSNQDISQKMVDLWVQIVEGGGMAIELRDKLIRYLKQALKDRFGGSIDNWKAYCERIASSKYLMGEKEIPGVWGKKWRASLDWCLKFSNIDKVLSGNLYGFGDRVKKITVSEANQATDEAIAEIQNSTEIDTVKQVRIGLVGSLGVASYNSWIKPCTFSAGTPGVIDIKAQTGFRNGYVETHFKDKILTACRGIFPQVSIDGNKLVDWDRGRDVRMLKHRDDGCLGGVKDAVRSFIDHCRGKELTT